ncbi:MAG: hypothetical protein LBP50_01375 [Tannerella sp.]|jgi:hypothetical protein|nr:hypothetical protein [Tannerella sp.]
MPQLDYLPHAYGALLTYLGNQSVVARLGLDPARIAALSGEIEACQSACTRADSPNAGKADRLNRKEKAKSVETSVRHYVNVALRYNENLTGEDRIRLGLTVPDGIIK